MPSDVGWKKIIFFPPLFLFYALGTWNGQKWSSWNICVCVLVGGLQQESPLWFRYIHYLFISSVMWHCNTDQNYFCPEQLWMVVQSDQYDGTAILTTVSYILVRRTQIAYVKCRTLLLEQCQYQAYRYWQQEMYVPHVLMPHKNIWGVLTQQGSHYPEIQCIHITRHPLLRWAYIHCLSVLWNLRYNIRRFCFLLEQQRFLHLP